MTREVAAPARCCDELTKTRLFELDAGRPSRGWPISRPLVLVFEDLQWADSATADLLGFLVRNLSDAAVLFVCTYRSDELGRDHR